MFSTLQPWLRDAVVLDLFAGSGSLGLEALSRGARHVRMVERGAPALAALRKNVEALRVRDRIEVIAADALKPSSWLPAVDVVFLDPPYALLDESRPRVLGALARLRVRASRSRGHRRAARAARRAHGGRAAIRARTGPQLRHERPLVRRARGAGLTLTAAPALH